MTSNRTNCLILPHPDFWLSNVFPITSNRTYSLILAPPQLCIVAGQFISDYILFHLSLIASIRTNCLIFDRPLNRDSLLFHLSHITSIRTHCLILPPTFLSGQFISD